LSADPDLVVEALLELLQVHPSKSNAGRRRFTIEPVPPGPLRIKHLAHGLRAAIDGRDASLLHLPLSWDGALWPFRHPLDFIGQDGGAGVGAGPGISVGAALALKGSGRLPIGVCGDGDVMMGCTAVWTAVHYRIPLLIVVANNRSFYNDEVHQERVAVARNRPVENKWIGQRISDPDIDMAQMARAQGAHGFGPANNAAELEKALKEAIAVVENGGVAVVDTRILPTYSPSTAAQMARGKSDRGG